MLGVGVGMCMGGCCMFVCASVFSCSAVHNIKPSRQLNSVKLSQSSSCIRW